MIRLLIDEDFNHDIVRGLVRRIAGLDLVGVWRRAPAKKSNGGMRLGFAE